MRVFSSLEEVLNILQLGNISVSLNSIVLKSFCHRKKHRLYAKDFLSRTLDVICIINFFEKNRSQSFWDLFIYLFILKEEEVGKFEQNVFNLPLVKRSLRHFLSLYQHKCLASTSKFDINFSFNHLVKRKGRKTKKDKASCDSFNRQRYWAFSWHSPLNQPWCFLCRVTHK